MYVGLLSSILKTYVGICPMGKSIENLQRKGNLSFSFLTLGSKDLIGAQ